MACRGTAEMACRGIGLLDRFLRKKQKTPFTCKDFLRRQGPIHTFTLAGTLVLSSRSGSGTTFT